jgi:hypothetical protein
MRRDARQVGIAAAVGAALAASGTAPATTGSRADFDLALSPAKPAATAELTLHVRYKAAGDDEAKPSPIRKVVVAAPPGTRFNTDATANCDATDDQLMAQGSGACPPESRIGAGKLTADTGFGPPADPVAGDLTLFNGGHSVIEVVTAPGTDRTVGIDRLEIAGSTLTGHPPTTPGGPPDGETAVRQIDFTIDAATRFVTTPAACPASRVWTSTGTFGFADGAEETLASATACKPAKRASAARLTVAPTSPRVGRPIRFRARVEGAAASCTRGATVRIGGRRARTGPGGRARLTVTVHRPGAHRATAKKPGCPTLAAPFVAVP